MESSINKSCIAAIAVMLALFGSIVRADFDEATRAYLLGNYEQARYEALIAATDGNPKAQMLLGQLYFNGEGVKKDIPHALHWYNKSAENGFADAQFRLGLLYHDGTQGVARNYDIAYKWLSKALENGNVVAREKLEWLFKTEQGNVVNLNENVEVLKQVATSGNQQARFLLSQKMLKGAGIPQDKANAVKMLREDAELGFVKAQKQLGELYFYGDGLEKDYIEAYGWSMAYAGTKELGGIAREGKQTARSALRKLPEEDHEKAYVKSKDYFENFVLPFHKNAREVGPDKYRIVVRSEVKKGSSPQQAATTSTGDKTIPAAGQGTGAALPGVPAVSLSNSSSSTAPDDSQKKATLNGQADSEQGKPLAADISKQADSQQQKSLEQTLPADDANAPKAEPSSDIVPVVDQAAKAEVTGAEKVLGDNIQATVGSQEQVAVETTEKEQTGNSALPKSVEAEKKEKSQQLPMADGSDHKPTSRPVASREDMEIISSEPERVATGGDGMGAESEVLAERKFEDVYNVLVRKKPALYKLYTREYELDKKLEGRVVFEIVVSPDGKISTVEITSNTLESPTLEQEFIDYLKANVTFEPAQVPDFKISYPVDFLPPL